MLGKLIKYDLKATYRLLVPLHIIVILASFLARFVITSRAYEHTPNVLLIMGLAGYIVLIVVVTYTTIFVVLHRFYKNLFTDEGYLTLTLPVTPHQHFLSKVISGGLWMTLDYIVMMLSIAIAVVVPEVVENADFVLAEMSTVLEMPADRFLTFSLALGLVGCVTGSIFYYFCIALGQLFPKHRLLAAVIIYFALSTVISTLTLIGMLASGFMPFTIGLTAYNEATLATEFTMGMFKVTIIETIIQTIVCYIGTLWIMNKKLNLE